MDFQDVFVSEKLRQKPQKQRNSSVEMLRLFFMFCIVLFHVYLHGSHFDYEWIYSLGSELGTSWNLVLYSLSMLGVTGFMFISGYYGVNLSCSKLFQILFSTFFYALTLTLAFSAVSLKNCLYIIFAFENYWYVSSYLAILILSPIINKGIKSLSRANLFFIVMCLFAYTYVAGFINLHNSRNITFLLTIYLFARYVYLYPNCKIVAMCQKWGGVFLNILMLLPIAMAQFGFGWRWVMLFFLQNNNPLLLFVSAWLFLSCENKKTFFSWVNYLAASTLAIYLITDLPIVRENLCPVLLTYLLKGWGLFAIIGICFSCALLDKIPRLLFKYIDLQATHFLQKVQ